MPRTCEQPKTVSAKNFQRKEETQSKHSITNVLGMLMLPQNSERLLSLIKEGINSLQAEYFENRSTVPVQTTLQHAAAGTHLARLAVFFLILNVDENLKQKIIEMEISRNHSRLVRFYDDLHKRLAHDFLANERQSVQDFVDACEETWLLA